MPGRALVAAILILAATRAFAQVPSQEEQARTHYAAGGDLYARGQYREALREFQLGYTLSPRPEFLINFAQAYRKLGEFDHAIVECERYLATGPHPALAAQAQRLLAQIREERARAVNPSPNPNPNPNPNREPVPVPVPVPVQVPVQVQVPAQVQVQAPPPKKKSHALALGLGIGIPLAVGAVVGIVLGVTLSSTTTYPNAPLGAVDFK